MANLYNDTDLRMLNDPAFHAVVDYLMHVAREHGFTPGELKQMAFRAALELEMRNPGPGPYYSREARARRCNHANTVPSSAGTFCADCGAEL